MLSDRIEELARLHKPRPNSVTPEFAGFCNRDYEQYPCSIAALLPVLRAAAEYASARKAWYGGDYSAKANLRFRNSQLALIPAVEEAQK